MVSWVFRRHFRGVLTVVLGLILSLAGAIGHAASERISLRERINCEKALQEVGVSSHIYEIQDDRILVEADREKIEFEDIQHGFGALAELNPEGGLELYFNLKNSGIFETASVGVVRSDVLFGEEVLALVMEHFHGRIRYVRGHWLHGDNLGVVNRLVVDRGEPLERAIAQTWTGLQAAKYGYTKITIVRAEMEKQGRPPFYWQIDVQFRKPSR